MMAARMDGSRQAMVQSDSPPNEALALRTREEAEGAMACLANLESSKAALERRIGRYRRALTGWAVMHAPAGEILQLRHGNIHIPTDGAVRLEPNVYANIQA